MAAIVDERPKRLVAHEAPVATEPAVAEGPVMAAVEEPVPAALPTDEFWVQVGAFKFRENAARLRVRLEDSRRSVVVRPGRPDALPWVLAVGPYTDERAAHEAEQVLAGQGYPGFVVRGDQ
jgi:cell division septation protein DedD